MAKLTQALNKLLANSYALALKTQNYHWNVLGPQFHSLHVMFEQQYTEYAVAIDEIAERIRTLGDKALGSFEQFIPLLEIREGTGSEDAGMMLKQLARDQATIVDLCRSAMELVQGDQATEDLLIQRMQVHQKNQWMLESSMG